VQLLFINSQTSWRSVSDRDWSVIRTIAGTTPWKQEDKNNQQLMVWCAAEVTDEHHCDGPVRELDSVTVLQGSRVLHMKLTNWLIKTTPRAAADNHRNLGNTKVSAAASTPFALRGTALRDGGATEGRVSACSRREKTSMWKTPS
jgi:hypothetical protein